MLDPKYNNRRSFWIGVVLGPFVLLAVYMSWAWIEYYDRPYYRQTFQLFGDRQFGPSWSKQDILFILDETQNRYLIDLPTNHVVRIDVALMEKSRTMFPVQSGESLKLRLQNGSSISYRPKHGSFYWIHSDGSVSREIIDTGTSQALQQLSQSGQVISESMIFELCGLANE